MTRTLLLTSKMRRSLNNVSFNRYDVKLYYENVFFTYFSAFTKVVVKPK